MTNYLSLALRQERALPQPEGETLLTLPASPLLPSKEEEPAGGRKDLHGEVPPPAAVLPRRLGEAHPDGEEGLTPEETSAGEVPAPLAEQLQRALSAPPASAPAGGAGAGLYTALLRSQTRGDFAQRERRAFTVTLPEAPTAMTAGLTLRELDGAVERDARRYAEETSPF